jgi:hypothetical protein
MYTANCVLELTSTSNLYLSLYLFTFLKNLLMFQLCTYKIEEFGFILCCLFKMLALYYYAELFMFASHVVKRGY